MRCSPPPEGRSCSWWRTSSLGLLLLVGTAVGCSGSEGGGSGAISSLTTRPPQSTTSTSSAPTTTEAPVTTTEAPTPTTSAPTPTTAPPPTAAPTTAPPVTAAPTTAAPTTQAPTTTAAPVPVSSSDDDTTGAAAAIGFLVIVAAAATGIFLFMRHRHAKPAHEDAADAVAPRAAAVLDGAAGVIAANGQAEAVAIAAASLQRRIWELETTLALVDHQAGANETYRRIVEVRRALAALDGAVSDDVALSRQPDVDANRLAFAHAALRARTDDLRAALEGLRSPGPDA